MFVLLLVLLLNLSLILLLLVELLFVFSWFVLGVRCCFAVVGFSCDVFVCVRLCVCVFLVSGGGFRLLIVQKMDLLAERYAREKETRGSRK
jgi:hypothetical protein